MESTSYSHHQTSRNRNLLSRKHLPSFAPTFSIKCPGISSWNPYKEYMRGLKPVDGDGDSDDDDDEFALRVGLGKWVSSKDMLYTGGIYSYHRYMENTKGLKRRPTKDDEDDGKKVCCVCLEDVVGEGGKAAIKRLECKHEFHMNCIKKWCLRGKNCCPICRRPNALRL